MGAGIIPTCIYKNKLHFLLGKENKHNDTPGWSDFGGGKEKGETLFNTAIREGYEELSGFLGSKEYLKNHLKEKGTYKISDKTYTSYLFYYPYNKSLEHFYNNHYKCIDKALDPSIIKNTTIFEKSQIKWVSIDELNNLEIRKFYQSIIQNIINEKSGIERFIKRVRVL
jgi:8-oxo-dGTP pyrophosphatase MutT (NUDIX family)